MRRRPHPEPLTQRSLNHELRRVVDLARLWAGSRRGARYTEQVVDLVSRHPRGTWSSHVQHNLGRGRRAWLASLARERGLLGADDGSSLAQKEEPVVRDHPDAPVVIRCDTCGRTAVSKQAINHKLDCRDAGRLVDTPQAIRGDVAPIKRG